MVALEALVGANGTRYVIAPWTVPTPWAIPNVEPARERSDAIRSKPANRRHDHRKDSLIGSGTPSQALKLTSTFSTAPAIDRTCPLKKQKLAYWMFGTLHAFLHRREDCSDVKEIPSLVLLHDGIACLGARH